MGVKRKGNPKYKLVRRKDKNGVMRSVYVLRVRPKKLKKKPVRKRRPGRPRTRRPKKTAGRRRRVGRPRKTTRRPKKKPVKRRKRAYAPRATTKKQEAFIKAMFAQDAPHPVAAEPQKGPVAHFMPANKALERNVWGTSAFQNYPEQPKPKPTARWAPPPQPLHGPSAGSVRPSVEVSSQRNKRQRTNASYVDLT